MEDINVFEHIYFRIAGESFSKFDNNRIAYSESLKKILLLIELENRKINIKSNLCTVIFEYIKKTTVLEQKNILLNFKRDIYNERNTSPKKLSLLDSILTDDFNENYSQFISIKLEIQSCFSEIQSKYNLVCCCDLELIKNVCRSNNFQNGLLLASPILLKFAKDITRETSNISDHVLLGLWKYLTRTIAKTSPFSTFTNINLATASSNIQVPFEIIKVSNNIYSYINYNNYILENIFVLMKNNTDIVKYIDVELNCTIKKVNSDLFFLSNNNNIESFQTVKNNSIISYIIELFEHKPIFRVGELVTELKNVLNSNYSTDNIYLYLFELSQTGLLNIKYNISGLDGDWVNSLKIFFKSNMDNQNIGSCAILILEKLELCRSEYCNSEVDNRGKIIDEMKELFYDFFNLLKSEMIANSPPNNTKQHLTNYKYIASNSENDNIQLHRLPSIIYNIHSKNLVYEDTSKDIHIKYDYDKINKLIFNANYFFSTFSFACLDKSSKALIYDFYSQNYKYNECVRVLDFYEKFFKTKINFEKNENLDVDYLAGRPFFISATLQKEIMNFIKREEIHDNINLLIDECHISKKFVDNFEYNFKDVILKRDDISYASFIQLFTSNNNEGDRLLGIVNSIFPGKGKMISRFLQLFNKDISNDLMEWNTKKIPAETIYAENIDASFFNANLHPSIMPYEIKIPGGNCRNAKNNINIADLKIKPNLEKKELELFNNSDKKVVIYDLDFIDVSIRSNLFKLLSCFGPNNNYLIKNINHIFNIYFQIRLKIKYNDKIIYVMPRIIFDRCLIIQRKQWHIPIEIIREKIKKISSLDQYIKYIEIQKWRLSLKLPDDVFLSMSYRSRKIEANQNRDDKKPQYINFLSPLSIKLFIRNVNKYNCDYILIEEMLPDPQNLSTIGNDKFAMEALIQWQ